MYVCMYAIKLSVYVCTVYLLLDQEQPAIAPTYIHTYKIICYSIYVLYVCMYVCVCMCMYAITDLLIYSYVYTT